MYITPTLRLVRQLGQGGMGSVWIADHLGLHTQVVVKFMAERLINDQKSIERFTREAAAAAQIKSPHVAQVFDHGVTAQGIPYIVMELLEGHDLGRHLRNNNGVLPVQEVSTILFQVAKALQKAHERGIVHRDIKPDNIFLCDAGSGDLFVKLLDFGIAKGGEALTNATNTGAVMGTPYYMSPEQMVGAKYADHRSDLWSLGVVAYQCITGTRPFTGDTYGALAIAIHSGPLPAPTQMNPNLPPGVDAWFAKACSRDVNTRFKTARELAEGFAVAIGQSVSGTGAFAAQTGGGFMPHIAQPTGTGAPVAHTNPETVRSSKKSSGVLIAAAIGVAVLLGGVIGGVAMFGGKKPAAAHAGEEDDGEKSIKASKKKSDDDKADDKAKKPEPSASVAPEPTVEELPTVVSSSSATAAPPTTGKAAIPSVKSTLPSAKPSAKPKGKYDDDIK